MDGQDDLAPVGGPPLPPPGPPGPPLVPVVEPLDDMGSIGAAVNTISNDKAPIINVLESMSARMDNLAMENSLTRQENLQLLTSSRKAKLASTLARQMFSTRMGADKQSSYMCTEYARDTIEQLWLQWGLEKQMSMMSISKEGVEKASPPSPPSQSQ